MQPPTRERTVSIVRNLNRILLSSTCQRVYSHIECRLCTINKDDSTRRASTPGRRVLPTCNIQLHMTTYTPHAQPENPHTNARTSEQAPANTALTSASTLLQEIVIRRAARDLDLATPRRGFELEATHTMQPSHGARPAPPAGAQRAHNVYFSCSLTSMIAAWLPHR